MSDCSCTSIALLAIGAIGLYLLRKYFKGGQFTEAVSARGKVAVVTGGNTGIGLETVKDLNLRGAKVYMLCRSEQRASAAKSELVKAGCDSSRLIYVNCDLSSMENVRKCAARLSQLQSSIDILINNAGVWAGAYEQTKDGHEITWGTNHLGHFLLTELLLPLVEKAPEGRIVNVASLVHYQSAAIDLAKIDSKDGFDTSMAYNKSKLANVMHARELTRRLKSKGKTTVTVNSLHPGVIATELLRNLGVGYKIFQIVFAFFMKSWKDGAQTSLYCALSSEVKGVSGLYFSDCASKVAAPLAHDDLACKQLNYFKGGQFTEAVSAIGKVAVVTGGNTGIGLETVREFNRRGAKLNIDLSTISKKTASSVRLHSTAVVPLNRFPPCGPPPLKRTKRAEQERIKGRFSEETIQQLRRFVHVQFFAQYKRVTLKKICDRSNEWIDPKDKDISISPSILRLLLHAINFSFVKLQYRSNIYMNDYYCRVQSHFLRTMVAIREAGNHLIWSVDETWVHKGMRPSYGWNDMEAAKAPLTFIKNGMTAGNSRQWEKGERLVIVACLSEEGFRCPVIWRTGKKDDGGDYHKEMDSKLKGVFKELVAEADEKSLKPILLMDNASYHSRVINKMPTQSDRKAVMADWLKAHDMQCPDGWKKRDMVEALKKLNRKDYNKYVVDTMGEQYGVQVVRTPPYMAEYAPIEFGWSAMKRAQHDLITHTDDGKVIRAKLLEWMNSYPAEKCKKYMDHCKGKRIEEGALTFCPSLSTEEIVAASDEIMDEADPQPVEDLEELLYMSDDEEEEYSELL
ncbi:hypothetical protein PRIPAC_92850 [Pristionchus pacificus]|uniref:Dehydrogenase n=1 Tax=Pristionchus pacificus TaxID=54126 RepID=A0A2A6BA98_PRIPA|nr:hypothetical protein PRIPAC_92850 [Pristionchus pacificus]|eukprot:PDM62787.1 dehydrogenase [Pristionchus pacificus]